MIAVPPLTLATNITATALILWRVWCVFLFLAPIPYGLGIYFCSFGVLSALHLSMKHHGVTASHNTGQIRHLLEILIESGGLYCVTWLILLCFILTGSPASHVCLSILGQLTVRYSLVSKEMGRPLTLDFFFWHREYTRL